MVFIIPTVYAVETEVASVSINGDHANWHSGDSSISADGRFVAFTSGATNLEASYGNGRIRDIFITEHDLFNIANDLLATLQSTSGATPVGDYIRFRARLTNNSDTALINCNTVLINPLINYQREFSFYSRPLNFSNPQVNGSIDIAPGEIGQIVLAVLPRVAMLKEIHFNYTCDNTQIVTIPY